MSLGPGDSKLTAPDSTWFPPFSHTHTHRVRDLQGLPADIGYPERKSFLAYAVARGLQRQTKSMHRQIGKIYRSLKVNQPCVATQDFPLQLCFPCRRALLENRITGYFLFQDSETGNLHAKMNGARNIFNKHLVTMSKMVSDADRRGHTEAAWVFGMVQRTCSL